MARTSQVPREGRESTQNIDDHTSSPNQVDRGLGRFDLPGYNLPLDHFTKGLDSWRDVLFPTALDKNSVFDGWSRLRLTPIRELTMLRIMEQITNKPSWEDKVFDDDIALKWKQEALAIENLDITAKMMDWVIAELRWKAEDFARTRMITVYSADVVKSDDAIPATLKDELQQAARVLENVPEWQKDWHPGSNGKVLDLVHPSLFPLVYGRSRIVVNATVPLADCKKFIGLGERLRAIETSALEAVRKESPYGIGYFGETKSYSTDFQWLPCDVELKPDRSGNENTWRIVSYINNLDPEKHMDIYRMVEQVISKAIPLWDRTLDPLYNRLRHNELQRIEYNFSLRDPDPDAFDLTEYPQQEEGESRDDFEARLIDYDEMEEQRTRNECKLVLPEPGIFEPPAPPTYKLLSLKEQFGSRGLQVIVKFANIHLTPESPSYEGGSWHIEGQLNEHICATALYYFDNANITDSRLSFRQLVDSDDARDIRYPQDDHQFLEDVFGCKQHGPEQQDVGSVLCKEGRLITFPNILLHKVEPFKLADPNRPGHRKILALFLVDPNLRIISTANIPPQQRDWWFEVVKDLKPREANPIAKLPEELKENVFDSLGDDDFPISLDKAKELRLKLMEERSQFVKTKQQEFERLTFNLCEH